MNERIEGLMKDPKKGLLILAWPMIISTVFSALMNFVDFIFVGGLGTDALAAVQISFPIFFIIIALGQGITIGATSLIAKRLGEKNKKWAEETALHALLLAAIISVIVFPLIFFAGDISQSLGGSTAVGTLAGEYIQVLFGGVFVFFLMFAMQAILQGEGDTKTPMKLTILYTVANIILDPVFIYYFGMGVSGAAVSTVVSAGLAMLGAVWYIIVSKRSYLQVKPRDFIYTPKIIKNILKVGLPAGASQIALSIAVLAVNLILSDFGDSAITAYGVGFRVDSLAIMPMLGLSAGVIPMVGFYRGAQNFISARRVSRLAMKLVAAYAIIMGATIFALSGVLPSFFTSDAGVMASASEYLRIAAFGYPFLGITIVLSAAFQGLGRGMPSLTLTMSRAVIIIVPLCYYLAYFTSFGVTGVWIGLALSMAITAIFAVTWIESYYRKLCGACEKE